jgi:mono/diheme cytochrome c family protein
MKKTGMAALVLGMITAPSVFAAGNAAAGKEVFLKRCAPCHGEDGNGKEAIAKMMNATIPPLSSKEVQALSDDQISKVITAGKDKMKPVTGLSAAEVTNLVAFVRSLAKK